MLKQRVITALLLLPLAMAALFLLPGYAFVIILSVVLFAGSIEYARIAGLGGLATGYLLIFIQLLVFISLYLIKEQWSQLQLFWLLASCIAWLLMFTRLLLYRPDMQVTSSFRAQSFVTALVSISSGWFALSWVRLQDDGAWLILLLLLIVWAADTGAYISGKAFGRHKLAAQISPGKTVEGLLGGLLLAPLVALLAVQFIPMETIYPGRLIALSLVAAFISVGGDLLISMHKRISGHKDSGKLLPGHGGILDRLDSLLAAAPFFALGLLLFGFWE